MRSLEEIVAANAAVKPRQLFAIWSPSCDEAPSLIHVTDSEAKCEKWMKLQGCDLRCWYSRIDSFDVA